MIRSIRLAVFVFALFGAPLLLPAQNASPGAAQANSTPAPVDVTGMDKLAREGPNAIDWVAGPLSRPVPAGARSDIVSLKEMLRDEASQGPAGNPAACKLGIQMCDLLLQAMTDRETTIAKAQANDQTDADQSAKNFFDRSVVTAWTQRANRIRTDAEAVYDHFRTAARPSLLALHGGAVASQQDTGSEPIFAAPPPAPASQPASGTKPVVFSTGGGGPGDFQIISASFGADKQRMDVTSQVRKLIADHELQFTEADWNFGSDPAPKKRKSLAIDYYANGVEKAYKAQDRVAFTLP